MKKRMNRRGFAKAGAAASIGLTMLESAVAAGSETAGSGKREAEEIEFLDVRPYQLMCIICRMGEGRKKNLGDARLDEILAAARENPVRPVRLRLNHESVYRYQNPGKREDTPEGELFNAKRDLDIIQKLGLVPGDARPAIDMFERIFTNISTAKGICGYETLTGDTWKGCPRAKSGNYEKGHALGLGAVIPGRDKQEKAEFKKTSTEAIYEAKTLRIRPHHLMCMSCFFGGRMDDLAPIQEDNLFEAIDVIHKNPDIPVTLIRGTCMICPPCSRYDSKTTFCLGGRSMALRDQKKDLDVLQKLGLKYGDTLPARKLYELLFERIPSTRDVCGYGDGKERVPEWSICRGPEGSEEYRKAREAKLGMDMD
ncbi:MAG: hypothetical protein JXM70_12995 [Pirellulales bacterium]|nr:hypothetical protein [Pirellulales bacterium]